MKKIFNYYIILIILSFNILLSQDKQINKSNLSKPPDKTKKSKEYNNKITNDYLELFNEVFSRLERSYVDSINDAEVILSGIKGMMSPLDPYTKILMGRSKENYEILARGKYGGVGMKISEVRDTIIIIQVFEDSPSYFEGLMAGDMILKVDSTSTIGLGRSKTVKLLKGDLDTPVTLHIFRNPGKIRKEFMLRRSNIKIKHIPYWGINDDNIGYIKLTKFSKNTSKDFKEALIKMSHNGMKGLIIDLRYNGGGLLRESINILDFLLSKNTISPILIKKGKASYKEYFSKNDPIISLDIPIVLLQNKRSASASVIVSGTLQDLDRAVIIGQSSFGKGLVQMTNKLNDSISVKITTSKYYLPSGRIIQKTDYLGNNFLTDGLDKIDSTFYTSIGRKVKGGRGIIPDIVTNTNKIPSFISSLSSNERLFISFSNEYAENITEDAFLLYKKLLKNKYDKDYLILDSTIFSINILKNTNSYYSEIISNKKNLIHLLNQHIFLQDIYKIYKQLNRYEKFNNLTFKNIDEIILYAYMFKNYFIQIDSKDKRPVNQLKEYLINKNLYSDSNSENNKKISGHSLYQILSKLLNILNKLHPRDIEDIEQYLFDIDYANIKTNLDRVEKQQKALTIQIILQSEVIDWYIKNLYGKILSPHPKTPFSQSDKDYIIKELNIKKQREIIIDAFKDFVDEYKFVYKIEGEKEFDKLKKKLLASSDFYKDSLIGNDPIKIFIKNNRYNKLTKNLEKYIKKKKKKYFYKDENERWLINMILREYSKIIINNSSQIKTSLYIDSEYYDAIDLINDKEKYSRILSLFPE